MVLGNRLRLSVDQASNRGVKPRNEDCIGIRIPDDDALALKGACAVIADGVSAATAGKEASEACVTGFLSDYYCTPDSWTVKHSAHKVLMALNQWLCSQGQRSADEGGYITTLSTLILKSTRAHLFHVGDSRVYRLRQGSLEQLTTDHQVRVRKDLTYLARAMGMTMNLEIDYRVLDLEAGDLFLLTTDGIHDVIAHAELTDWLTGLPDTLHGYASELMQTALSRGSDDNLSCQLIRVDSLGLDDRSQFESLSRLPFPPPLSVGQSIDGYTVEQILHESTRSQTYRVRHVDQPERDRVMKTPSVNYDDDPAYIERFLLEDWIAARIQSSHVVRKVDPVQPPSALYYLTEFVPGVPLSQWIRDHTRPDINRVVAIAEQIVKAVRALHRKETLHQDIKPDNLLIDNDDHVTLIDFGSCWIPGIQEIQVPIERERALGTARYSAPEYALTGKGSERSEQFSVALVTYEMLTGKHPYGEKYESAASPASFARLRYVPAYEHNPLVPVWLDGALRKALQLDPRRRYESFSEWVGDLKTPNPRLMPDQSLPLAERNPVVLWQGVSAILLVALIVSLVL